jgi:hypothetical protein
MHIISPVIHIVTMMQVAAHDAMAAVGGDHE